jgi:hypothetical protein
MNTKIILHSHIQNMQAELTASRAVKTPLERKQFTVSCTTDPEGV